MVSVETFLRRIPQEMARAFMKRCGVSLPENLDWSGKVRQTTLRIKACIEAAGQGPQSRVMRDYERIASMADEAGQIALLSVCKHCSVLERLENAYSRAYWLFENEFEAFRRAEEARYTDEHRRGRNWTGVLTKSGLSVRTDLSSLQAFKAAVLQELKSENIHVDVFERRRKSFDGKVYSIIQVTIYREGPAQDYPEFINGNLDWRSRRPVYEAAVTYEARGGVVEVVAENRDSRENLLQCFVRDLLGESDQQPLPLREFNLDPLLRPCTFPTDPRDGIEWVRVTMLRLQPFDSPDQRITLECASKEPGEIWSMANVQFGKKNPLMIGYAVTQAKLVIRFHPEADACRGKTLPLTVKMPHGCDLKGRTSKEMMIGEKYLKRWNLLCHA